MTDEGILKTITPTKRDIVSGAIGAIGGAIAATKVPKYVNGIMEGYHKKQAEIYGQVIDERLKAAGYGAKPADPQQDVLAGIADELKQNREMYKTLNETLTEIKGSIKQKAG